MKTKLASCICLALFSIGLSFGQDKAPEVNNYQFGQPEHYLDGYSMNFQYQNGSAIHMEFYEGMAKYEWVAGPSKGNGNKDIAYKSLKIGDNLYLVSWHETGLKDYLTLVFDFDKMLMHNSIIIGYQNKPERRLKTISQSGIIDHLKIAE
ncbi:MoaF-related domain-containing protein [Zobellia uliginosa]|uniref:MoaF-related domain-containing protein n=1 Tax=Zobellia uliginosa TaxID=143224 RepID=UPI0026E3B37F|nr:MoaF C-terminal domain-containing protein [Zobellia uliginosa]MDO6516945.1 MoaF C-terminal domain-containing protein [Zobellia uliginosa]